MSSEGVSRSESGALPCCVNCQSLLHIAAKLLLNDLIDFKFSSSKSVFLAEDITPLLIGDPHHSVLIVMCPSCN